MSHDKNKVEWCMRKAEKELNESGKHKGLVKINPDASKAKEYISKAEHYLKATAHLKDGGFSDICTSTLFYSIYHCFLAIAAKSGYESRNQECTFALIKWLVEEKKLNFDSGLLSHIFDLNKQKSEETVTGIREQYQYGTKLSIKDNTYNEMLELARKVISRTKEVMEE